MGFITNKRKAKGGFTSINPLKKTGLNTSVGLYKTAIQAGLQKDADRILKSQLGEETKKIFSGGFISDIFDVLNTLQYGVTGVLKGKTFLEGVKTRQSFSDKDALGDNGLPGVIAGIALDIAVDPLTYIAPATIIRKIPFATKLLKAAKEFTFGKMVKKAIKTGEGTKAIQQLEGGTKVGKYLASKTSWLFGADPVFRETWERGSKNIAVGTQNVVNATKGITNLSSKTASKLLRFDETGRVIRVSQKLLKGLTPEELEIARKANETIESLGKEMVGLKMLSKETFEKNINTYIQNNYEEFISKKKKGLFGFNKIKVKGIKARKKGLTPEKMKELGQITDPGFLYMKTVIDMKKDIETVKLFNEVSRIVGSDVAQEGFKQLPKTQRLFTTATGEKIQMLSKIKNLNKELKPVLKELKSTFKFDKTTLSEIHSIEKNIDSLKGIRKEEFFKFFREGAKRTKKLPKAQIIKGVGKLPDNLRIIGDKAKEFKKFNDLMKSDVGIELEKLYRDGVLERAGFKDAVFTKGGKEIKTTGLKQFFNFVKKPFKELPERAITTELKGDLAKIVKLQKNIEGLSLKATKLRGINKRSIDDSFRFLEETVNKIRMEKEGLIEQIGKAKLGELSGKFVPEHIFDYIQEISQPAKFGIGKKLVANFKFFKVVMNPGTHGRNIISNKVLNWWKLGMNPLDPRTINAEKTSIKEIFKKGGKWTDEARPLGYNLDTFASNELNILLDAPEAISLKNKVGKKWDKFKKTFSRIYQGEENQAKLSSYIFNRKYKGLGKEDAWKAAESATFNYAQVTPFVRKLRESLFGFPFITFTIKATPIAIETALKYPRRISVLGKIKNSIENLSDIKETERERASEPPWIRDGFFIKLPIKDKHNRSAYFDLTYIIPFGDLVSGDFFGRQIKRKTGTLETLPEAIASKSPALNLIKELSRNQDFYGNKIWRDSDSSEKQLGDIMRHLTKTYLPPLVSDQIPGGYKDSGERTQRGFLGALTPDEEIRQKRTIQQELLRHVGAKIQPIDADIQETYQEWNKKKALETLLQEQGILKRFERSYIPKEK